MQCGRVEVERELLMRLLVGGDEQGEMVWKKAGVSCFGNGIVIDIIMWVLKLIVLNPEFYMSARDRLNGEETEGGGIVGGEDKKKMNRRK